MCGTGTGASNIIQMTNIAYFSCSPPNIKFKIWTTKQHPQHHQNFFIIQPSSKEYSKLSQNALLNSPAAYHAVHSSHHRSSSKCFVYHPCNKCSQFHYTPTYCSIALFQSLSTDSKHLSYSLIILSIHFQQHSGLNTDSQRRNSCWTGNF